MVFMETGFSAPSEDLIEYVRIMNECFYCVCVGGGRVCYQLSQIKAIELLWL